MKKEQQDNIWGPAKFNREMKSLGELTSSFGLPRLIITGFLVLLFILAPVAGVDFFTQITNCLLYTSQESGRASAGRRAHCV